MRLISFGFLTIIFSFRISFGCLTGYPRLFTFLLLFLWLLCSMVRSLVRLWFYGMRRMRMVGMVNIGMLMMLATYYSLYHRCSSSMDNWSWIYEDNFWETSFRNNYDPFKFSTNYFIHKCVPWNMESKYFPVLLRYWNNL